LAIKPTVGGIPNRERRPNTRREARRGERFSIPFKPSIESSPVRMVIAITVKNTAKFVNAYPAR